MEVFDIESEGDKLDMFSIRELYNNANSFEEIYLMKNS